jgi:sugar lactone lactonase YvrE
MPPAPEGSEVVAQGLNYPRQLTIGPDGTIYVAETGLGGDVEISTPDGTVVRYGLSGQITSIAADGTTGVAVSGLPSVDAAGEPLGPSDVAIAPDGVWVAINGSGPTGVPAFLGASNALKFGGNVLLAAYDFYSHEMQTNADGNAIDSNLTDIEIAPDGTVYFVDTGANTLYKWTDSGPEVVITWPENPVPTGVAVGPNGNLFVSFLGTEIAPGAGMVEEVSPEGEVVNTWTGFNALTDIAVADDGSVYVVSIFAGFGAMGPNPGQVLKADQDGGTVLVDGLATPYGIAIADDGSLLVTVGSVGVAPGSGMVLRFAAPAA